MAQLLKRPSSHITTTSPAPSSPLSRGVSNSDPLSTSRFYAYPPSWTMQPNLSSRGSQLASWSRLVQQYCAFRHIFRLSLSEALDSSLFHNASIGRRLNSGEVNTVLEYMVSGKISPGGAVTDGFEQRAEWVAAADHSAVWVYWKKPDEWAELLAEWVDSTGQKGVVLTLYELTEGEAAVGKEWVGMPDELLKKVLAVLVKRGKAQVFGGQGEQGVKFF